MKMKSLRFSLIGLPLVVLAAACANSPDRRDSGDDVAAADVERLAVADAERVRVPGSRLLRRADPDNPHAATGAAPVRIYGEAEIEATGRTNIAEALRQLDPAVGGGGR